MGTKLYAPNGKGSVVAHSTQVNAMIENGWTLKEKKVIKKTVKKKRR